MTTSSMTTRGKLTREAASSYVDSVRKEYKEDGVTKLLYSDLRYAFIAGAEWATTHPEELSNLTISDLAKLIIERSK